MPQMFHLLKNRAFAMPNLSPNGVCKTASTLEYLSRVVVNDARNPPPKTPTPTPSPMVANYLTVATTPLNGPHPQARVLDMWVFCRQLSALYGIFLDKVTASPVTPQRSKVFLKTLMFRAAVEANIVATALKVLVEKYTANLDLGQHQASLWSLANAPAFKALLVLTDGNASEVFGGALANFLSQRKSGGKVEESCSVEAGYAHASDPNAQGISYKDGERIDRELGVQCDIWESAIEGFKREFNPLHPQEAVVLMADTARLLRQAAASTVRLVECDYRNALGLTPIEGGMEAESIYQATIRDHGIDPDAVLREELLQISREVEINYEFLLRNIESGATKIDPMIASQARMESRSWREQVDAFSVARQGFDVHVSRIMAGVRGGFLRSKTSL